MTLETESTLYLSLASVLGFEPIVILGPLTGVLVDRWNRKALIGTVDLLQALTTVALIFLFQLDVIAIWQVMALLTLKGVFQAFHTPAVLAIIPTMIPKEKLSRMNGVNYLFTSSVNLAGPVVAAVLFGFWGISQILWIDAATFLVALVPLLMITIPSIIKKQDKSSFRKQFGKGVAFIRKARGLLPFIMVATGVNFLLTPLTTLLPYFVKVDHFGVVSDLAFVMASIQGGMLAGGLIISVIKVSRRKNDHNRILHVYSFSRIHSYSSHSYRILFVYGNLWLDPNVLHSNDRCAGYDNTPDGRSYGNARESDFSNHIFGSCCTTNRHASCRYNNGFHWNSQPLSRMCCTGSTDFDTIVVLH